MCEYDDNDEEDLEEPWEREDRFRKAASLEQLLGSFFCYVEKSQSGDAHCDQGFNGISQLGWEFKTRFANETGFDQQRFDTLLEAYRHAVSSSSMYERRGEWSMATYCARSADQASDALWTFLSQTAVFKADSRNQGTERVRHAELMHRRELASGGKRPFDGYYRLPSN